MTEPTTCCRADGKYCDCCDLLVGLDGLRVIAVDADGIVIGQFTVTGHDLGNAQVCAADLAITCMDGQPDGLVSAGSDAVQRSQAEEALLARSDASTIDEIVAEVDGIIANGDERGLTAQQIGENIQTFAGIQGTFYTDGATGQEVVDGYLSRGSEGETWNAGIITKALGLTSSKEPGPRSRDRGGRGSRPK